MKKVFYKLLLVFAVSVISGMIFALPVLATALYTGTIQVTNNSTAASNVATNFTLDTQSLIDNGFCASDLSDVDITYNSAHIPFMPGYGTNPWCLFLPAIGASSIVNCVLSTGGATGGSIAWFPGTTGGTVPDGMAEPAADFSMNVTGFLDATVAGSIYPIIATTASNQTNGTYYASVNVTMPTGIEVGDLLIVVIEAAAGGLPTLTAPGGWTQLVHDAGTTTNRFGAYYKVASGNESTQQVWTSSVACTYSNQCYRIKKNTYSGVPAIGITASTGAGVPDPPNLVSGFGAVPTLWLAFAGDAGAVINTAPAGYSGLLANNDPVTTLNIASAYKFTLASASDNPGAFAPAQTWTQANTIAVRGSATVPVIFSHYDTTNGGIVCVPSTAGSITVFAGASLGTSVTINGLTSIATTVRCALSGGTLTVTAQGISSSVAFAGAIPNSTANWTFVNNSVMPYVESITYYQGGAKVDLWDWEYATTFTGDTTGNVLTPSFRTSSSDSDVSAELISFAPTSDSELDSFSLAGELPDIGVPTAAAQMYTEENYSHIPGGPGVNEILSAAGVPYSLWWFPFIYISICFIGFIIYGATQGPLGQRATSNPYDGSLLTMAIVMEVLIALFGIMNPVPLWPAYLFPIPALAIISSRKHTSIG